MSQYIVDFFCPELMLAIEIDGDSHRMKEQRDLIRQNQLERLGVHFIRFENKEVKQDMNHVLETIEQWVKGNQDSND
ncbi:MAG: DUF559 domain-containing protein [Balneolales bacterium]